MKRESPAAAVTWSNHELRQIHEATLKAAREARRRRRVRFLLGLAELVVGTAGLYLLGDIAGWKGIAAAFLLLWSANLHAVRQRT